MPTPALDDSSVAAVADGGSEGTDGEKSGYSDADIDAFLERALPPPISRLVSHIAADFERRAALAQAVLVQEWAVVARAAAARALATQLRAALPASPPRPVKQEASLEDSGAEDSGVSEPASKRMAMTIPSFEDAVEVEVDDDYDEETPGIYPGERTKKKTDRAGDPTHYEGGGTDTAEKCTSNDIWKGRGRGRKIERHTWAHRKE